MSETWEARDVAGREMQLFVASPEGAGPRPAVVVICHAGGVDEFVMQMTRRIAGEGYVGAAPDLFHRQDPAERSPLRLLDVEIIQDVEATIARLQNDANVRSDAIGIIGFCLGGRVSYMMAGVSPELKAAVSYYGGFSLSNRAGDPPAIERLANAYCPVLGFSGEDDQNPSLDDMRQIDEMLTKHNKPHEIYSYPNASHGFMDFTKDSYREPASTASWPVALGFLERNLGK
jgi:carboxymethylenebutenolidase